MTMQTALGVVGGVIGAFFGYPQLGFVVGSLIGAALTPAEKTEGPRLDDLKVTVSTYGVGIPKLLGTDRLGGNVIWCTDRQEYEIVTEQGGKGGGGVENTSYGYRVHMRIGICETPADGAQAAILMMFADGKLVYDARSGASFASALASAVGELATAVVSQGGASQLPDPTEEAWEGGPGSVPAYRNIVSIHLENVECPGGRVPQLSFVMTVGADLGDVIYQSETILIPQGNRISASQIFKDGSSSIFFAEYSAANPDYPTYPIKRIDVYSVDMERATKIQSFGVNAWHSYNAVPGDADIDALCFRVTTPWDVPTDTGLNAFYDAQGGQLTLVDLGPTCLAFGQSTSSWSKRGNYGLIAGDSNQGSFEVALFSWTSGAVVARTTIASPFAQKVIATDNYAWIVLSDESVQVRSIDGTFGLVLDTASFPPEVTGLGLDYEARFTGQEGDKLALWACDPEGELALVYDVTFDGLNIVFTQRNSIARVDQSIPHPIEQTIGVRPDAAYGWQITTVGGPNWEMDCFMVAFDRLTVVDPKVSDVIAAICELAGETRYDVSTIPDSNTLHGYKLANPGSARSYIDPLLTAFDIYVVDEDGLIKFKKYDAITSLATISFEELGQSADGAFTDPMPLSHRQEIDLPRSATASYIEATFDYQTASETELRQVTESIEDVNFELPMVISAAQAKTAAMRILYSAWRQQNTRSFKTSRKYAWLSPGDGVTVEYPRGTFKLWRIMSMDDDGLILEFNVEPGDASIYAQQAIGSGSYTGQEVTPLPPQTHMVIGDWPLLRDADNNPGIYTAFRPLGTGWRGVTLYVGDDDTSLEERGSTFDSCAIGVADSVLGPWSLNIIDQANTLTVSAPAGAFSSITYDQLVASQTLNALAVGQAGRWEILQFATANYLGGDLWLLYDFKRAQRGTEYAVGTHQIGDMVVELNPAGMLRPNMEVGGLDQVKKYRAVSVGRSLNSVASQSYTNTGEGLRPFSPVNLLHSLVGSDIVFTWNRRTRLSNNWLAGVVPLGEAGEAYQLTLYTDSTFSTMRRYLVSITPTVTYTAALMAEDGYTPGQPLYVRVQQIGGSGVGLGHALEATL